MTGPVKKSRVVDLTLLQKLLRIFQDSNRNFLLFAAVLEGGRYFVRFLSSSAIVLRSRASRSCGREISGQNFQTHMTTAEIDRQKERENSHVCRRLVGCFWFRRRISIQKQGKSNTVPLEARSVVL